MDKPGVFTLLAFFYFAIPYGLSAQFSKTTPADYSKEAFITEQSSDNFKFENDGSYTREMRARVRIQSDAGVEHFSVIKFAFQNSSETFAVDYVRVTKPDGTVVTTPSETFQDMPADITREAPFYSDAHEMQVAVKGLGVGGVLEYQAHWQHNKPLVPGQFWLDYNFEHDAIVLQEKLEITLPHGRAVKLKSSKAQPVISHSGQYDLYAWTSSNLENKDDKQQKQELQERTWQQVRGRAPNPDIELSTFQNWDALAHWFQTLENDRVQPTPEIKAKATELTKGLSDDDSKIRAIYDFVSTKFRYIGISFGIGRYQPHTAAEVLANQYGDCKDKHTLFASLLAAVGIKAYPALISTTHDVDEDVPSPGQFNHMITAIPQKTGILWLDTTTEVAPFGILIPPLRDKHALVIADDKPAALMSTIVNDPFPTLQKFEMDAKLNDAGVLEGKAQNTDRGDTEILFRAAFRMVPLSRWKDLIQRVSYGLGFAGDVSDVDATAPESTSEPFRFSYSYKRKDYSDWSNRRITPPVPPITLPAVDDEITPTVPIWLGSPGEIDFHATLKLPKGYSAELPKAVHIKRDFADYDATYSLSGGVFTSDRILTVKLREIPPSEYEQYKSFRKAVEDDYGTYTSLSSTRSAVNVFLYQDEIWNLPYSENAEASRLYDDAREQYQRHDMAAEIASLKKAVDADPKFIRAWLWLGEIYKASGQNDLAIQAYKKAVEIDPEQPVSYKALGSTLSMLQRSDEAIAIWQQLIKIAPEKPDGYANLGMSLLSAKRYREAIAPFESATRISPDQAALQMSLGIACLNAGQAEKAQAAFQQAVKLDPGPPMLNNVAYELAEKKSALDTAKEYSERAVKQEEAEAAKIEIAQLGPPDLAHAQTLATFWDTLGWVFYQLNDLESATKYLTASWDVSQSAVVGDHLGRVYEKQGRKVAALHLYQLAHSAIPLRVGLRPASSGMDSGSSIDNDLKRLGGKPDPAKAVTEMNQMRTFELPRLVSGTATATFYVLLGPGKKIEVKFVSGAESLRSAEKALMRTNYKFAFPDDSSARLARTGMVNCFPYSGCSMVFLMPSTITFSPPAIQ